MAPSNERAVAARPATTKDKPTSPSGIVGNVGESAAPATTVIQPAQGQHPWLQFEKMYSRDDPQIREWLDIIEERRRQDDLEFQRELDAE
ncbi:MAG: hypothetical protein H7062_22675 [Candidatus Saccharimonas sp.]|nr:hypothetical protein [Planctomycetaceae bacterium]